MAAYGGERPHFMGMRAVDLDGGTTRTWLATSPHDRLVDGPFAFAYCSSTVPGVLRAVGPPPAPHRVDLWPRPPHPWRWKPGRH